MANQFKIYKSSAGSGKTFTLVKEYLCLVLRNPGEYKNILALTFTNKATEEMKSRIIESLIQLSRNENESLKNILSAEIPEEKIQPNAQYALDNILHDYSNFSVTTIDSFFNRIIRSLAREMQLPLRMEVKIDQEEVITDITSQLLLEISTDKDLLKWLTDFAIQKLSDDKGWNIEREIHDIAKELFRENSIDEHLHSRVEIKNFFTELKGIKARFENQMKAFGNEGMNAIASHGLEVKDFAYGESGVARYFDKIRINTGNDVYLPGKRADDAAYDSSKWFSKSSPRKNEIHSLAESTLQPLLQKIIQYVENEYPSFLGAVVVLKRIFLLGIVEDLSKKLKKYRDENSLLLISDPPKILSKVISEEETPFVYEKSGTRYLHFLIDEFQDTSDLQWKNILPLVINSLGGGNFGMVVGDVKQSIYRWRSGNMNLLDTEIEKHLQPFQSLISKTNLETNYRSRKTIVHFNNDFFSAIPPLINKSLELDGTNAMDRAYTKDSGQKVTEKNNDGGRVEIHAIDGEDREDERTSWKVVAQGKMLEKIKDAIARGYSYGDIAILLRTNSEGDGVATFLIENGITQVISPDSLLMIRSPEVRFLLNILIFLDDRQNFISKSEILFYYSSRNAPGHENTHSIFSGINKKTGSGKKGSQTLFETEHLDGSLFSRSLPQAFTSRIRTLSKLPLYELCEQLVHIFGLLKTDAYVLRFLELILEFSGNHDNSVRSFLNWWYDTKSEEKISVITSETGNAIRVMSIHKSKGLQFPIVIMPFTDWKLQPDGRDVLWVESDVAPFNGFGKIPVSPTKAMKQSCFAESYQHETILSVTDNINLMYVAFTRAEEELYIFTAAGEIKDLNSTGKLLRTVIHTIPEWSVKYDVTNSLLLGETLEKREKKEGLRLNPAVAFELQNYAFLNWHDKIRLSLKSDDLIEILDSSVKRAINYGVLVHRVLSSIQNVSDAGRVVEKFHADGIITEEEKEKLQREIQLLLEVKEIASFFTDEYTVMNEHEILMPDGETLRPDRVLLKDGKAIIIDFKTGKEHAAHQKQINSYADALAKMDLTAIEKYLIYISEKRILRVQ